MGVCVLGSINRDIVARVATLPRGGETVAATGVMRLAGGKGANQATAAARAGAPTRMIGAVGADEDGAALLAGLAAAGVGTAAIVRHDGVATGTAYIALNDAGENQIIVDAGANAWVSPDAAAAIGAADRIVLAQLETPVAAVAAGFAAAGRQGSLRILNAAPALPGGAALFADTDILIVNETELAAYLGLATVAAGDAAAARRLFVRPDQQAVVTLGAAGAALVTADAVTMLPGRRVPVIDTTGAGDCFCGVLAAMLDEGRTIADALALATIAASLCVGRIGAGSAMPTRAEIMAAS